MRCGWDWTRGSRGGRLPSRSSARTPSAPASAGRWSSASRRLPASRRLSVSRLRPVANSRIYTHTVVVTVCGDVGEADSPRLRRLLVDAMMRRRPRRIVVDLAGATALDATAIGPLLAARDSAPDVQVTLALRRPNPAVAADLRDNGLRLTA